MRFSDKVEIWHKRFNKVWKTLTVSEGEMAYGTYYMYRMRQGNIG